MEQREEKNCYIQKDGKFFTYTRNCEQKANIAVIKSTLRVPPRHNGIIPMKIKGHEIKGYMAYFISNHDSKKGKVPNIHIIDGIINIKGKTYSSQNYTNKHITFNRGEYVAHLEPPIEDIQHTPANTDSLTNHSITMERRMAKKVENDTFELLHHKLKKDIGTKLEELLQEYQSQFTQDKNTIGTTPLTKITIDNATSEPVSQKPYPLVMKHFKWV